MSTENCTTADLLRCVEDWVAQGPAVEEPMGTLITLDSSCPASIRLRSDPLCKQVVAGVSQCNTTVPSTETCIGIPILAAAMVAELLLAAAIAMLVTVAALLVHSNKGKRRQVCCYCFQ